VGRGIGLRARGRLGMPTVSETKKINYYLRPRKREAPSIKKIIKNKKKWPLRYEGRERGRAKGEKKQALIKEWLTRGVSFVKSKSTHDRKADH